MKGILINLVLLTTLGLIGCSSNTQDQNTGLGAVAGAAIGGVGVGMAGGKAVAIGAGIVGGALIGGLIGHSMDNSDNVRTVTVIKESPTNRTSSWVNSKTGVAYTMTPTSGVFMVNGNPNCRNFHFTATRYSKIHEYDGTACVMSDGYWHTVRR